MQCLQSYMFFQLRSFDRSLPDSAISTQAGMLQGSFTAAQFVTAMLWGRISDADWGGRKKVLLAGLLGTCRSGHEILRGFPLKRGSHFQCWLWICSDILAGPVVSDSGRCPEWQRRCYADDDIRNHQGEEVCCTLGYGMTTV